MDKDQELRDARNQALKIVYGWLIDYPAIKSSLAQEQSGYFAGCLDELKRRVNQAIEEGQSRGMREVVDRWLMEDWKVKGLFCGQDVGRVVAMNPIQ